MFIPRTRKEIKACEWFQLDCLPSNKTDTVCKTALGINANSFFMILPFVKRLKRFLADHAAAQLTTATAGSVRLAKKNGGNGANAAAAPAANKRRQRNKSTSDLDGVKGATSAELKPAPVVATTSRPNSIHQPAANVSSTNVTPAMASSSLSMSQNKSQKLSKTKNSNFKRQLFLAGSAPASDPTVVTASVPVPNVVAKGHTSNPLAVARVATTRMPIVAKSTVIGKLQAATIDAPLSIAAKFNGAATSSGLKTTRNAKPQKLSIESLLQAASVDSSIQQWHNFTFPDRAAIANIPLQFPVFPVKC